jgi:hypothetical protein
MILRYVYRKPFTVRFPDKGEWQNGFTPNIKVGLIWYIDGSKTNKGTGVGVCRWGSGRKHNFSLGLHTTQYSRPKYIPLRHV